MSKASPVLPYDCPDAMDPPPGTSWAALLAHVPSGAAVLDIGCSTGAFDVALKRKGCHVTGVEVNPVAAEVARSRCDAVHVGDITQMLEDRRLPSAAFDVIVAGDVLEHLVDPSIVVRGCRRLLRPGGFLLASLPNVTHTAVILEMCRGRFQYRPEGLLDATHLRFFDQESALALFTDAGYNATLVDRVRHDPRHTEFASRLDVVPDEVLAFLDQNPCADTYQFIVRADPAGAADRAPRRATPAAPSAPLRNSLVGEVNELHSQLLKYHDAFLFGRRALPVAMERPRGVARRACPAAGGHARVRHRRPHIRQRRGAPASLLRGPAGDGSGGVPRAVSPAAADLRCVRLLRREHARAGAGGGAAR